VINRLIVVQIETCERNSGFTSDEYERMNPGKRALSKFILYEAQCYIQKQLGNKSFCKCVESRIKKKSIETSLKLWKWQEKQLRGQR
jgi:hypothetical protein